MFRVLILCSILVCSSAEAVTHYVDLSSPSPIPPYTSWATAATNIQDAVDAAVSGDVVLVTNGYYLLSSEISVNNDISVQSVNGPSFSTVDGGGNGSGCRCFNLGNVACVVSGFTIANGYANGMSADSKHGGGVYCDGSQPIVTNCIIVGNYAFGSGGGMYEGTAHNCTFSSNQCEDPQDGVTTGGYGGGKYGGTANDCIFTNNHAAVLSDSSAGGGMYGGVANNCTFINNYAGYYGGGGMASGTATNCAFINNQASHGGGMSSGIATDCVFSGNYAGAFGGGIFNGTANNCTFSGNGADYQGGGMHGGTANNSIFIDNYVDATNIDNGGGGMYNSTANNCTITACRSENGGGMYGGTANNCIIWNNLNKAATATVNLYGTLASSSCSQDLVAGVNGNINGDPLFTDPTNGNYRINTDSPCFNAGTNSLAPAGTDLDGFPRIAYGTVDIGAYEVNENYEPGDDDGDGLSNYDEILARTDINDPDSDDDGLNDGDEVHVYLTDPNDPDSDDDGLSDWQELNTHDTDPILFDTDGDGLSDGAEINTHGTDPNVSDMDNDGLKDGQEILTYNTNPQDADTDNDGFDDGFEVNTGYDPTLASSTPDTVISIYTAVEVHFNAASGSVYRIEGTDSLSNPWSMVESGIQGNGGIIQRFYSTLNQSNRFFRAIHE